MKGIAAGLVLAAWACGTFAAMNPAYNQWRADYDHWLTQQRYCLVWCPGADMEKNNYTPQELYPDLPPDVAQMAYDEMPDFPIEVDAPQLMPSMIMPTNAVCCHICTKDCFKTAFSNFHAEELDLTLVTFANVERFEPFEILTQTWQGPMIVLFWLESEQQIHRLVELASRAPNILCLYYIRNTRLDDRKLMWQNSFKNEHGERQLLIPINALRNVVFDRAVSKFVFPIDIDLIPSRNLYQFAKSQLHEWEYMPNAIFVPPAWGVRKCAKNLVHTKEDLNVDFEGFYENLRQGFYNPFYGYMPEFDWHDKSLVDEANYHPSCRNITGEFYLQYFVTATNYEKWLKVSVEEEHPLLLPLDPQITSRFDVDWEPYIIVPRFGTCGLLPRYIELFPYGERDKVSWVAHLRMFFGMKFFLLTRSYLMHKIHPPLNTTNLMNQMPIYQAGMSVYRTMLVRFKEQDKCGVFPFQAWERVEKAMLTSIQQFVAFAICSVICFTIWRKLRAKQGLPAKTGFSVGQFALRWQSLSIGLRSRLQYLGRGFRSKSLFSGSEELPVKDK